MRAASDAEPLTFEVEALAGDPQGLGRRLETALIGAQGRLLAIETNPTFAALLAKVEDPRFTLVHGDATVAADYAKEHGLSGFDLVISGIPFSMLSDATRKKVVDMTHGLLRPGGVFLVYQTSPLMLPYLKRRFKVRTSVELRNVPPYFIMQATKK